MLRDQNRPIRGDDEDVWVDSQVFPIAAANVEPNGTAGKLLEEALNNGPRLLILSAFADDGHLQAKALPCTVWMRNEKQSVRRHHEHAFLRTSRDFDPD